MSSAELFYSQRFPTHQVKGYEEFKNLTDKLEYERSQGARIFVYFTGEKMSNGKSWCPDCVRAEPFLESFIGNTENQIKVDHLIVVDAGNREQWKDKNNSFRTILNITNLPTLIRWKGPQKLTGDQITDDSLLALLFEDEDYL